MMKYWYAIAVMILIVFPACRKNESHAQKVPVPAMPAVKSVADLSVMAGVTIADDYPDYTSTECLALCDSLFRSGVRWIAVTPCGFITTTNSTAIHWTSWSDRDYAGAIRMMRARGLHVLLKPYLWSNEFYTKQTWTGSIAQYDSALRKEWFDSYSAWMLDNARYAEQGGAEMLCVGVELPKMSRYGKAWRALIASVRKVYHGKLVYAAHGLAEAEEIRFWDALDAVGVDMYPSLTTSLAPTDKELHDGWQPLKNRLAALSSLTGRKIIFTEAGFRSIEGATARPWEWPEHASYTTSEEQQTQAYRILAEECYHEPWFGGIFWWKLFTNPHNQEEGPDGFTPQNKPAFHQMIRDFTLLSRK